MFWLKLLIVAATTIGKFSAAQPPDTGTTSATVQAPLNEREFRLITGDVRKGKIASANEQGLVLELDTGGFSERIPWAKFTQDTLKKLLRNPDTRPYATPFIEIPPEVKAKERARRVQRRRDFVAKTVPRVELPSPNAGLMATATTPVNLIVLGLLFAGNLYAAYEIAAFRNRSPALVCVVSVFLPVVGPLAFLSMPTRPESEADLEAQAGETAGQPADHPAPGRGVPAGGLSMAKGEKAGPAKLQPVTFTRGEATFDRRFFEIKFSGYFRVVLGEAEKEFVLVVKTVRNEYIAQRIARITGKEMHLQLLRGGTEAPVNFGEITQVELRPRSAVA